MNIRRLDFSEPLSAEYTIPVSNRFQELRTMAEEQSPEELWTSIKEIIGQEARKSVPVKRRTRKPWISEHTLELIEERRKAKMKGSTDAQTRWVELCKEVRKSARKDKRDYITKKCESMEENMGNTKFVFQTVKDVTREFKPRMRSIRDESGNVLTEDEKISRRWQQHCSSVYGGDK